MTRVPSIQSLLKKYQLRPKKRLGQHFLIPMPTIEKIVSSLDLKSDDIVVEIGSGLGVMTSLLANKAGHVFAIEKDKDLTRIAKAEFGHNENITWLETDVLKHKLGPARHKITGNLPYNISSPILFWMLDQRKNISAAVVMLQKEVCDRIIAKPNCKDYGTISILIQSCAVCKRLFDVSAKSFVPPPDVTSSVIKIDFKKDAAGTENEQWFRKVVRSAFGKRRKTIRNSLLGAPSLKLGTSIIDRALKEAGIDPKVRPEQIPVSDYIALSNYLSKGSWFRMV